MIYCPLKDEIVIFAKYTKYEHTPLSINSNRKVLHQLITLLHHRNALCGINIDKLYTNNYKLHPIFFKLICAIYNNNSFKELDFFTNFDPTLGADLLYKIESTDTDIDISTADSQTLVGALLIYLQSLETPLFGHLTGTLVQLQEMNVNDSNIKTFVDQLIKSVKQSTSIIIIKALFLLFNS